MFLNKVNNFTLYLICLMSISCGISNETQNSASAENELILGSLSSRSEVELDKSYFVSTSNLNVRSEDTFGENSLGKLQLNDEIRIINNSEDLYKEFVEIEILSTESIIKSAPKYYVSFKYLNETKIDYENSNGKYYIVQNLATERLRVYEKVCMDKSCPNKMILEVEMVVGEETDNSSTMTNVGSYKIIKWKKFYQDGGKRYPSWWDDSFPAPPKPGSSARKWTKEKYMPNGKGNMRGAFGWFTAIVGFKSGNSIKRDPNGQWTHGTIGWGSDKKKFIEQTKKFWANVFADPRSHGCSRVDNESIAYMREILPVGTPLIKIYAIEKTQFNVEERYGQETGSYSYTLTKEKKGKISNASVEKRNVDEDRILERGTATLDITPDVMNYTAGENLRLSVRRRKEMGNVYGIKSTDMYGVFYIDTGLVQDYRHPTDKKLKVGGDKSEIVPEFMKANL